MPLAPVTRTLTARPTRPPASTRSAQRGHRGAVDLGVVPDVDRQRRGDQHGGHGHRRRRPHGGGEPAPASDAGGGACRPPVGTTTTTTCWVPAGPTPTTAAAAHRASSGLDPLLDADRGHRPVGGA